jgi:hypothetical protein
MGNNLQDEDDEAAKLKLHSFGEHMVNPTLKFHSFGDATPSLNVIESHALQRRHQHTLDSLVL